MKYFKLAMQIAELLYLFATDNELKENFREVIDNILDPIEEKFQEDKQIMKTCKRIRKLLDTPDDDDIGWRG